MVTRLAHAGAGHVDRSGGGVARAGDEAAPGDPVEVALAARVAELGHGLQLRRPAPGAGPRRGEVDVVLTAAEALFHFLQTMDF